MDHNLATVLEAVTDLVTARAPDHPAVVCGQRRRSWPELDQRAARLAGHLAAHGVRAGDRVGLGLHNSVEYVEALYATFKLRAVPVNINYRYRETELAEVLRYTGVRALVFDDSLDARVAAVAGALPELTVLLCHGPAPASGAVRVAAAAVDGPALPRIGRSGRDEILILTGGTTGRPKAVVWEHAGVLAVVSSVYDRNGLPRPTDLPAVLGTAGTALGTGGAPVMLAASPFMHGTGFFFSLGNLLLAGTLVCLAARSLDPAEAWRAVVAHQVVELAIVGDAFARPLVAELDRAVAAGAPYDLTSLRRVASSGVLWSPAVKRALLDHHAAAVRRAGGGTRPRGTTPPRGTGPSRERGDGAGAGLTLIDSIASSEGGPYGVSQVRSGDSEISPRFTLSPNARVIGAGGRDVVPGSGEIGVLAATGPLPTGYLGDPDLTAATFQVIDGVRYAVPGDAARLAADGTLTLLGRGSAVVNTGGEKVYAEEVEQVLTGHPRVRDAVVVGLPDERWGSRITALVALNPAPDPAAVPVPDPASDPARGGDRAGGNPPDPAELIAYVGRRLAGYKRPRQVFFVDSIERSPAGKVDRRWAAATARRLANGGASC